LLIVIIDEFDRLSRKVAGQMADTIKMLSDYAVPATLVLVGVADTVSDLIQEHTSVERALIQIPMPRMSTEEIRAIIHVVGIYCGVPQALDCFRVARKVLQEAGQLPDNEP
ncbi:MAG: hypothetical protein OXJ64_04655, partial [Boseongicola sp.]|nr:hypothetical protein [Boseongicola sp.]